MHSFYELLGTIITIALTALGSMWYLGNKFGIIETHLANISDDVNTIRTNDLHHIDLRFQNIERVLMEGTNVREDSVSHTRRG